MAANPIKRGWEDDATGPTFRGSGGKRPRLKRRAPDWSTEFSETIVQKHEHDAQEQEYDAQKKELAAQTLLYLAHRRDVLGLECNQGSFRVFFLTRLIHVRLHEVRLVLCPKVLDQTLSFVLPRIRCLAQVRFRFCVLGVGMRFGELDLEICVFHLEGPDFIFIFLCKGRMSNQSLFSTLIPTMIGVCQRIE